jgi:hypothetical protein
MHGLFAQRIRGSNSRLQSPKTLSKKWECRVIVTNRIAAGELISCEKNHILRAGNQGLVAVTNWRNRYGTLCSTYSLGPCLRRTKLWTGEPRALRSEMPKLSGHQSCFAVIENSPEKDHIVVYCLDSNLTT